MKLFLKSLPCRYFYGSCWSVTPRLHMLTFEASSLDPSLWNINKINKGKYYQIVTLFTLTGQPSLKQLVHLKNTADQFHSFPFYKWTVK